MFHLSTCPLLSVCSPALLPPFTCCQSLINFSPSPSHSSAAEPCPPLALPLGWKEDLHPAIQSPKLCPSPLWQGKNHSLQSGSYSLEQPQTPSSLGKECKEQIPIQPLTWEASWHSSALSTWMEGKGASCWKGSSSWLQLFPSLSQWHSSRSSRKKTRTSLLMAMIITLVILEYCFKRIINKQQN